MNAKIAQAIKTLQQGKIIIITDDPSRENEGDFCAAAQYIDAHQVNLMITKGKGMICCPLTKKRAQLLDLPPQCPHNQSLHGTNFTVSVDAADCQGSGISALDRAHTIKTLSDPMGTASNLVRPGHIFPIVGHSHGLKGRQGHTEATLTLLELAQLNPVGVICEIINDHGEMARGNQLVQIAHDLSMPILSVEEIAEYCQ